MVSLFEENTPEEDTLLVAHWLKFDVARLLSGLVAGVFAGAAALLVSMVLCLKVGYEGSFAIKLFATLLHGPAATEYGSHSVGFLSGLVLFEFLCGFWGMVYAHFVFTQKWSGLLAMGVVWGLFSWIFQWNLFLQSFHTIYAVHIPAQAAFPVCLTYGVALSSLGFFSNLFVKKGKTIAS